MGDFPGRVAEEDGLLNIEVLIEHSLLLSVTIPPIKPLNTLHIGSISGVAAYRNLQRAVAVYSTCEVQANDGIPRGLGDTRGEG